MSRRKGKIQANAETERPKIVLSEKQAQLMAQSMLARLPKGAADSFSGKRDLDKALGYPSEVTAKLAYLKYRRNGLAGAVVDAPVTSTWQVPPEVKEAVRKQPEGDEEYQPTKFEQDWLSITERIEVWDYFRRVDTLQRTGRYAVLLIGAGADELESELSVSGPEALNYLSVYSEVSVEVFEEGTDRNDPRYCLPTMYKIQMVKPATGGAAGKTEKVKVHWSRIIHVSERLTDSDVYGLIPIERSYNRFLDTENILGASAEGYWRGGMPGMHANATDPEAEFDVDDLIDQVEEVVHGFKKFITTQGVDVKTLAPNVTDPSTHLDAQIKITAGGERIPQRLLIGNEAGELASSQDETNWNGTIKDRRNNFVKPRIIYQFIDRLIAYNMLAVPDTGYTAEWDESDNISAKDAAEIADKVASALQRYAPMNAQDILPPEVFLPMLPGMTDDKIAEVKKILEQRMDEGLEDEDEGEGADL